MPSMAQLEAMSAGPALIHLERKRDHGGGGGGEGTVTANVWAPYITERKGQVTKGTLSTYVRHGTEQRKFSENSKFTDGWD